jgi:hypothetical protein
MVPSVTHKYPIPGDRQIPEIGRSVLEAGRGNPSGQIHFRRFLISASAEVSLNS